MKHALMEKTPPGRPPVAPLPEIGSDEREESERTVRLRLPPVESPSQLLAGQSALLEKERRIFERIAVGGDLLLLLEEVAQLWEASSDKFRRCAVLLANEAGDRLWVAAAPSMPVFFHELAKDTAIAENSNPCGVAAWNRKSVLIPDFEHDQQWTGMAEAAAALGVRAGWSQPLVSSDGRILGTVAVYSETEGRPTDRELALMERVTHITRIAIEKYQAELAIERLSNQDALTGMPTRPLLLDRLDGAVMRGAKNRCTTALLLVSLGGMKEINEILGYEYGDKFLRGMAQRMQDLFPHGETVARVGGHDFGIILEDLGSTELLTDILQSLLLELNRPIMVGGYEAFGTACIGISVAPKDGDDAETLYRQADSALHRARQHGYPSFQYFTADMNVKAARRITLISELHHALERDEFFLNFQPQLEVSSGRIIGAEALLRWQHPRFGLVTPAEFIPLLEETGHIIDVGDWVLKQVCGTISEVRAMGRDPFRIAVNMSARQFLERGMTARIESMLREHGLDADGLTVEITETLLMSNPEQAAAILQGFREVGVRLAVDDFGTGYSSLSYLKKFPLDDLKIDKSFLDGVPASAVDAAIVTTLIQLAHSLGMSAVAEGVETEPQLQFLRQRHCDALQGFLCCGPAAREQFLEIVSRGTL